MIAELYVLSLLTPTWFIIKQILKSKSHMLLNKNVLSSLLNIQFKLLFPFIINSTAK